MAPRCNTARFALSLDLGTAPAIRRMRDITDGTSNTLMLAEVRQGQIDDDLRGLTWFGHHNGFTANDGPNTSTPDYTSPSWCNTAAQNQSPTVLTPSQPSTGSSGANPMRLFSRSRHTGGVQVAHCDGSIRFVSNNINLTTWRNLSSTQDGQTIGDF